jgi:hypothetical protein
MVTEKDNKLRDNGARTSRPALVSVLVLDITVASYEIPYIERDLRSNGSGSKRISGWTPVKCPIMGQFNFSEEAQPSQ